MGLINFHVHMDGIDAIKEKLEKSCTEAEHAIAVMVWSDTAPFLPSRQGWLEKTSRVQNAFVIYQEPYARFLYYGKVMIDPQTGSTWAKKNGIKVPISKNLEISRSKHPQATSHWFEASKAQNLERWEKHAEEILYHDFKKGK